MNIFEFSDYKTYLQKYLKSLPKRGHGESSKFAKAMGVNSTMVSQVLKGPLNLNQEQALRLTKHLGLNKLETEYFINLVLMARSGDKQTEDFFCAQLNRISKTNNTIKDRLGLSSDISEKHQATYYSHWIYSAIWLLSSIPSLQSREKIAQQLGLPIEFISKATEALVEMGLLRSEGGKISNVGQHIHIGSDSELVRRHHCNWRWVAMNKIDSADLNSSIFFTGPVVMTKYDSLKVREVLLKTLESFRKISGPSDCEELHCLNIDWFKLA